MTLIQGRPTLAEVLARQSASASARYVATQLARVSPLFQILEFIDDVIPNGRSGRIVYPYRRRTARRVGQLRQYYTDYVARQAIGEVDASSTLRPLGDAFETDRVFRMIEDDWVEEQIGLMVPAIRNTFSDLAINGDPGSNALEFEGLSSLLAGTSQEIDGTGMDFSAGSTATDRQMREFVAAIRRETARLRGMGLEPVILGNDEALFRIAMVGELLGFRNDTPDAFGQNTITRLNNAAMIDVGQVTRVTGAANGAGVLPTETVDIIPTVGGLTDVYVVGISRVNGFCGVTIDGRAGVEPIRFETARNDAGVLRRFEMEFVGSVALLDETAASVFRDVRVAPGA